MNPYQSQDTLLRDKTLSTNPRAIYSRVRMLTNDAASDAKAARDKKRRNKKKQLELINSNKIHTKIAARPKVVEARVRFHLSRGRDAADIVTREGIKASIILAIVAKIKAEA